MSMKTSNHLFTAVVTFTLAAQAHAEPNAATPGGPTPTSSKPGTLWLGGAIGIASPSSDGLNGQGKMSFDMAYAIDASADYQLTDLITLRAMPRYVLNLKGSMDKDSSSEYDLRAGATIGKDVLPKLRPYGLAAVGYSGISFPSGSPVSSASGFTLTIGAGATYLVTPKIRLYAEASYELGFQSVSAGGQSADYKVNMIDFGAGAQFVVWQ
jgi:hypothetical protein